VIIEGLDLPSLLLRPVGERDLPFGEAGQRREHAFAHSVAATR
jgi:hypothetical protein